MNLAKLERNRVASIRRRSIHGCGDVGGFVGVGRATAEERGRRETPRNQSLDVLRGVAVLLVLMHHYFHLLTWGWIGVDLFFVLSGFLISGLLFSELQASGTISVGRFLFRRGMKIYPSYFLFVFVTAFLFRELRPYLTEECLFIQNYTFLHPLTQTIPGTHSWLHTWSLAVEEHFYLIVPLLVLSLHRLRLLTWIPAISLISVLVCFVMRAWHFTDIMPSVFVEESHLRFDALFAGVALGYLWSYSRDSLVEISKRLPLWTAVPFVLPAVLLPSDSFRYGSVLATSGILTANLVASSIVIVYCLTRNIGFKRLAVMGRYSYSIYIWHMPIMVYQAVLLRKLFGLSAWKGPWLSADTLIFALSLSVSTVTAIALGTLMSRLIELPVVQLRNRLAPSYGCAAFNSSNVAC